MTVWCVDREDGSSVKATCMALTDAFLFVGHDNGKVRGPNTHKLPTHIHTHTYPLRNGNRYMPL
jgi:hypothetical protein